MKGDYGHEILKAHSILSDFEPELPTLGSIGAMFSTLYAIGGIEREISGGKNIDPALMIPVSICALVVSFVIGNGITKWYRRAVAESRARAEYIDRILGVKTDISSKNI